MRTVLFDLDGTILDTERIYQRYWRIAADELGYRLTKEELLSFRSLGYAFAVKRMADLTGVETAYDEISTRCKELMEPALAKQEIPVKETALEALQQLRENEFHCAIVTATKLDLATERITRAGLNDWFDRIISAHLVENGKPAPDVYLYACQELGVEPSDTYAVEDAPNGVLSAADAGCKTIMVPDLTQPDDDLRKRVVFCADDLLSAARYILSDAGE